MFVCLFVFVFHFCFLLFFVLLWFFIQIQLIHCIKQTDSPGGENQFADAFKVAEDLRKDELDIFQTLCNTPVAMRDSQPGFYLKINEPIIRLGIFSYIWSERRNST